MRKLWTESEINLLKVLYPHQPSQRIADVLAWLMREYVPTELLPDLIRIGIDRLEAAARVTKSKSKRGGKS